MASMTYCMFENTVLEMKQIVREMDKHKFDLEDLGEDERYAYDQLIELCGDFLGKVG